MKSPISKAPARLAPALCLLVTLMLWQATPAGAANFSNPSQEFTHNVCGDYLPFARFQPVHSTEGWSWNEYCPGVMTLAAPNQPTNNLAIMTYGSTSLPFTEVSFSLSGSNGSDAGKVQGVRLCNGGACGDLISPMGTNVFAPEPTTLTPASGALFPSGATTLQVLGNCATAPAPCPPSEGLTIHSLKFKYHDVEDPQVEFSSEVPHDSPDEIDPPNLIVDGWNRGIVEFMVNASDAGSGISFLGLGGSSYGGYDYCGENRALFTTTSYCPNVLSQIVKLDLTTLFPSGLANTQGEQTLRVNALDAAMNNTSAPEVKFKVDTRPPGGPRQIAVAGANGRGWLNVNDVDLSWTNLIENLETSLNSGVSKASWTVSTPGKAGSSGSRTLSAAEGNIPLTSIDNIHLPSDGIWNLDLLTFDRAGNPALLRQGTSVKLDTYTMGAPAIEPLGAIDAADVASGVTLHWTAPADADKAISRICGYAMSVNGQPSSDPGTVLDVEGENVTSAMLPDNLGEGQRYVHLRAVSCAGTGGAIATIPVQVDTVPPIVTTSAAAGAWVDESNPLTLTADDAGTGPSRVIYKTGLDEVSVDGDTAEVELTNGTTSVAYRAQDVAGNYSPWESIDISVDGEAPAAAIQPRDPGRPVEISASVTDQHSGISSAWFEYQPVSAAPADPWHAFGSTTRPVAPDDKTVTVTAQFPDGSVPDGSYRVHVVAYDRVGHKSYVDRAIDGSPVVLTTPLRSQAKIVAGFQSGVGASGCAKKPKGCKPGPLVHNHAVPYGTTSQLQGSIADAAGRPVPNASIDIFERVLDGAVRRIGRRTAKADGSFSFEVPAGPSRKIIVRSARTGALAEAEESLQLIVKSRVSLSVSPRRPVTGAPVTFKGRLYSAGLALPLRGKPVTIQTRVGGAWVDFPFAKPLATGDGHFSATFKWGSPKRFRFRAIVPAGADWPFGTGTSRAINVVVRRAR